jgi:pimeloyl-ACP methyl ester carboxylesterase
MIRNGRVMKRQIAVFLAGSVLLLAGCGGGGSSSATTGGSSTTQTPLPEYVECTSTTPVFTGNANGPVITLNGPRVISQPLGTAYTDQGATASDPKDGNITSEIVVTGLSAVDITTVGDYLIRYNVADSLGYPAVEVVRIVRVNNGSFAEQTARDIGTTSAHMGYYEHLPVNYSKDSTQTYPLIVFQHGWFSARFLDPYTVQAPLSILEGGDLVLVINTGLWDDSRPFIVLSPQRCVDPLTFVVTAGYTKLFMDYAINTYQVDKTRIYLAGFSQGSGDTWDYVNNYPDELAAVVPISGDYGTSVGCQLAQTPAWAFNGEADTVVPYMKQVATVDSINACNPVVPAKITVFAGIGHVDDEAMVLDPLGLGQGIAPYDVYNESIYDWMLQYTRPQPTPPEVTGHATVQP